MFQEENTEPKGKSKLQTKSKGTLQKKNVTKGRARQVKRVMSDDSDDEKLLKRKIKRCFDDSDDEKPLKREIKRCIDDSDDEKPLKQEIKRCFDDSDDEKPLKREIKRFMEECEDEKPLKSKIKHCIDDKKPLKREIKRCMEESEDEKPSKRKIKRIDDFDDEKPSKSSTSSRKGKAKNEQNAVVENVTDDIINCDDLSPNLAELVAKQAGISVALSERIIKFFNEEATIPFLVRYRSDKIGHKSADELRLIKDIYKSMKQVKARALFIKKTLQSRNLLTQDIEYHIDHAITLTELEDLYEPYKPSKTSKIQEANKLGLIEVARNLLDGNTIPHLSKIVDPNKKQIKTEEDTKEFLTHIIADMIIKDIGLATELPSFYESEKIYLESKKVNKTSTKEDKLPKEGNNKKVGCDNFANYYNFSKHIRAVKPHQILAINRGEKLKELKVNVQIPERLHSKLEKYLVNKWIYQKPVNYFRKDIVMNAIKTIAIKKLEKKIIKNIRSELTAMGEKAGLNVFSLNLKHLLLTRPVVNHTVLAIDPGFKNGCKIAVVSQEQKILATSLAYLSNKYDFISSLKKLIDRHNSTLIAIGNGVACRDVEKCVAELIADLKAKSIEMQYTIVSEQGLSIYSCSDLAKQEYPDLIPNLISAVSLAKRVIDPLGELIKVNPKNLGVGMYQHDLNSKRLDEMLNDVISEVVSLVGVNLNTAPLLLLKQISGLTESRAKAIISFRDSNGPFKCRDELLKIKGVGKKTFEQCAGFVRICPLEEGRQLVEPLDQTIIHPEDYTVATRFITEMCNQEKTDIGKEFFIKDVKRIVEFGGKNNICNSLKISESSFNVIYEALTRSLHYDIRTECGELLFRKEITTFNDLIVGQVITGRVENVTPFGAFVDIGIGKSELIPYCYNNQVELCYGQKVSVKVLDINRNTQRVSLMLMEVLSKSHF